MSRRTAPATSAKIALVEMPGRGFSRGRNGASNAVFRYNKETHEYVLNGEVVPSVTQLLERAGLTSEAFYDAKSAERGHKVHELCTARDLWAIEDLRRCDSPYKGWLLAYEAFLMAVRPEWSAIEEAAVSIVYRVGGRPDRVGRLWGVEAIVDIKSGQPERHHGIQTALYDVVVGELPAGVRKRYSLYLKRTGKFRLIPHDGSDPGCSQGRQDYDQAFDILQRFAR